MRVRSQLVERHLERWTTTEIASTQQQDGSSCGVFVAMVSCAYYFIFSNKNKRAALNIISSNLMLSSVSIWKPFETLIKLAPL